MPYDPKRGGSIIAWSKAATSYIEGKGVNDTMNLQPIDTDTIDALRANQRTRGQFVAELDKWYKSAKVGDNVAAGVNGTTLQNYMSGFKRAADTLKLADKVEILRDKDNNRVVLVKSA